MKKYEVMFIVNVANEEVIQSAVKLIQDTIVRIGGTVSKVDEWGKRKLAYEINGLNEGSYTLIDFHTDPQNIAELDRVLRINDFVERHMIVARSDRD